MSKLIFISILCVFIFGPTFYLIYSFNFDTLSTTLLSFLSLLTFSFPFLKKIESAQKASFLSLGLLNFILISTLISDAFAAVASIHVPKIIIVIISICFLLISLWWGRKTIVRNIEIQLPDLPKNFENFKIVQLSDLHIGHSIKKDYLDKVLSKTKELNPDLIVLTGDIGDSDAKIYAKEFIGIKELNPKFGILYVTGNHEYFWNVNDWIDELKKFNITPLLNSNIILNIENENILIGGITDLMDHKSPPNIERAASHNEQNIIKILLTHRPTPAPMASNMGFHLMISGHTHAGQFFPWTRLISLFHKHHQGLSKEKQMFVYVNRGTGSWGPLMRLDSTAEITCFHLKR